LDPAPLGINAKYSWKFKGGQGEGAIKFIDIEQGWILNHNSLTVNTLPTTGIVSVSSREHGAAVLGVVMMNDKQERGIGITPKVNGHVISTWRSNGNIDIPDAILTSLNYLAFGDILLLTIQRYQSLENRRALPIEFHDGVFEAISTATNAGITVIEAAGNGDLGSQTGVDLDTFESNGNEIFNRSSKNFLDSGAIIVGAGSASVPHRRISYSNYGSRVDCYAWGEQVLTTGCYPRSSGPSLDTVTQRFCGTSSAAAIIAGAAIAVQSICEANLGFRLSPRELRNILSNSSYGTRSANGSKIDKIGAMPNLKKIIDNSLKCSMLL
ncbi:MAG: peptidase, partial [Bacteroidetes bacterium]